MDAVRAVRRALAASVPVAVLLVAAAATAGTPHVITLKESGKSYVVAKGGTLLARDGDAEVVTPYDNCVLIMPTRRPKKGETAVRLGRFVH